MTRVAESIGSLPDWLNLSAHQRLHGLVKPIDRPGLAAAYVEYLKVSSWMLQHQQIGIHHVGDIHEIPSS